MEPKELLGLKERRVRKAFKVLKEYRELLVFKELKAHLVLREH
jgi:hypothetical protein